VKIDPRFVGPDIDRNLENPLSVKGYRAWLGRCLGYYGRTVDGEGFVSRQILLCPETAGQLYGPDSVEQNRYEPGSRPVLEAIVRDLITDDISERDKALTLMRFVRDLPEKTPSDPDFVVEVYGGTEEQIYERRAGICNELARLLICLAQIAGLPARYVGHHIGGHGVTEIYIEGGWAYIDVRGRYYIKPDGKLASTWEIWQNRDEIMLNQPPEIRRDIRDSARQPVPPEKDWIYLRCFHPAEVITITPYAVWMRDQFDYSLVPRDKEVEQKIRPYNEQMAEVWRELYGPEDAERALRL